MSLLLFAVAIATAGYLRFHQLGVPSYWVDEVIGDEAVTRVSTAPLWRWLTGLDREAGSLSYATQLLARHAGRDEWAGRLVPALCGLIAVVFAGLIARKIGERASGVFAVAMVTAVSPLHVYYSREARPYGLVLLFTTIALFLLIPRRLSDGDSEGAGKWRKLGFAIAIVGLLYTSAATGPTVLAFGATCAIAIAMAGGASERRVYWYFAIPCVVALLLFLPLYRGAPTDPQLAPRSADSVLFSDIVRGFTVSAVGHPGHVVTEAGMIVFALAGAFAAWRRDRRTAAILVAMTLLPVVAAVVTLQVVKHWFAIRYVLAGTPAFLILVGIGIAAVASLSGIAELGLTIVVVGLLVFDLAPAARREPMMKLDWRSIAKTIEQHARPGDVVIAGEDWSIGPLGFYLRNLPPGVKFTGLRDVPSVVRASSKAKASWMVTTGVWGYGEVREWMGRYPILLSSPIESFRLHFAPNAGEFVRNRALPEEIRTMAAAAPEDLLLDIGGRDDLMLGGAWGTREGSPGDQFRWALAKDVSVTFPVHDAQTRQIRVLANPVTHASLSPQTMTLSLNGGVVGTVTMNSYLDDYTFIAPAALWRGGINVLTFSFARATAPASLNPGSTDQRTLAAAIHRVLIGDPGRAREPMYPPRLASASLLYVRCGVRETSSRFDRAKYDRQGVQALLARLGFDPVEAWPHVAAGEYTIEQIANTAALDNACVDPRTFIENAFSTILDRPPNSVERRDLAARMRTGTTRSRIVALILRDDGFRESVLRAAPEAARGRR